MGSAEGRRGRGVGEEELRALAELLRAYDLTELEVEDARRRIRLRRDREPGPGGPAAGGAAADPTASPALVQAPGPARAAARHPPGWVPVEAPMVGTFYRAPAPEAAPFVREGDTVKRGQVLCIIEAMKLMNEIEAPVAGRVARILVDNGQPVEFGQPLFLLDPADR